VTGGLQLAATGDVVSGWPTFVSGIAIGALTIAAAIAIAWWQRVIQLRDRAAERAGQEALHEERTARQVKVARREVWQADYHAIRNLLECCEELSYHVRHEGPLTATEFAAHGVASLRMNSERLAQRGVPGLRELLVLLAHDLDGLIQHAAVENALTTGPAHDSLDRSQLHSIQRSAVLQDRAERELAGQITATWLALRSEWGN
jgi:hypothetical protein